MSALESVIQSGLTAYGVPGAAGPRQISEWGTHGFVITYGTDKYRIDVGVLRKRLPIEQEGPHGEVDVYDTLGTRLIHARHQQVADGVSPAEWFAALEHSLPPREAWSVQVITVNGDAVSFLHLAEGDHWIAFTEIGDAWLYVHSYGHQSGGIRLASIDDLPSHLTQASP